MSPSDMFDDVCKYIACFPNHPFKTQKYEYDDPEKELNLIDKTRFDLNISLTINIYKIEKL
jgi:hypothetical protein